MTEPAAAPRVSVVIPNWNGMALLRDCLDSLRHQTYTCFEVIVVDNASTQGDAQALAREYPEAQVVALGENRGVAGGCNAGMAVARGEILVMLNNDIEAEPDWLAELVDALERHPECGSAATRMMLYSDRAAGVLPGRLHSAGDLYRRNGLPDSRGVWQPYGPPWDQECYVFGGCGGAVAYRRAMLDQIGRFEEAFWMYCEDVDLNWRAQMAGWKCIYAPRAVVYHRLSATGGGVLSSYQTGRNTLWVIARNVPGPLLRRYGGRMVRAQLGIALEALRAWRGAAARARLRGQLAGLVTSLRWLKQRRQHAAAPEKLAYIESILD
jgi:GT2 family glycosyltransferase